MISPDGQTPSTRSLWCHVFAYKTIVWLNVTWLCIHIRRDLKEWLRELYLRQPLFEAVKDDIIKCQCDVIKPNLHGLNHVHDHHLHWRLCVIPDWYSLVKTFQMCIPFPGQALYKYIQQPGKTSDVTSGCSQDRLAWNIAMLFDYAAILSCARNVLTMT